MTDENENDILLEEDEVQPPSEQDDFGEPTEDDLRPIAEKVEPTLLNKVGLYTQKQVEERDRLAQKRISDAQSELHRTRESMAQRLDRLESERHRGEPAQPESGKLLAKYHETGAAEDLAAYLTANTAETEARLTKTIDKRYQEQSQVQRQAQVDREWDAEFAKDVNKDIDSNTIQTFFETKYGGTIPPEATIFAYRALQHPKGIEGFVMDMARGIARTQKATPGATTSPISSGGRRPDVRPTDLQPSGMTDAQWAIKRKQLGLAD